MTCIISGVSEGLGKALAELYLSKGYRVIGIGRRNTIEHPNFNFIKADLAQVQDWQTILPGPFELPLILINNAGVIEPISRLAELRDSAKTDAIFRINVIAPLELAIQVYALVTDKNQFTLANISSGAAQRAIPSWGLYCASKAALNKWTESFLLEENEKGFYPKVYAISPGVIDTAMQATVRSIPESTFSQVERFRKLKENNELTSPEDAAAALFELFKRPYEGQVLVDLRDIR